VRATYVALAAQVIADPLCVRTRNETELMHKGGRILLCRFDITRIQEPASLTYTAMMWLKMRWKALWIVRWRTAQAGTDLGLLLVRLLRGGISE